MKSRVVSDRLYFIDRRAILTKINTKDWGLGSIISAIIFIVIYVAYKLWLSIKEGKDFFEIISISWFIFPAIMIYAGISLLKNYESEE